MNRETLEHVEPPGLPELPGRKGKAGARVLENSVLVIDDDDAVRDSIAEYLRQSGFQVLEAEDGRRGLEVFRQQRPAVTLCDLRMPHLDGMSLLRQVAAEDEDAPIIVISGEGGMTEVVDALRLGACDYFIKPISDLDALETAIRRCMEQVRLREENRRYREEMERAYSELQANLAVLRHDQQAGRHVQMRLLPPSPQQIGQYRFCHRLLASLYLSGDFVDYLQVGDQKITFFIADISGHGASSAFVTALLKNFTAHMRSDFNRHGVQSLVRPTEFLHKANRMLLNSGIGKHMTMCVGVIDTADNTLCYSVAGHLPLPVIATADGARYLEGRGMPVGMFDEPEYEQHTVVLPERFRMYLFSDGLLEILPPPSLVDKEKYLIEKLHDMPQDTATLVKRFGIDQVAELPDDIALLMISRNT